MAESSNDQLKKSRNYIRQGEPKMALEEVHSLLMNHEDGRAVLRMLDSKVITQPPLPPELLSYYGLCIALADNRVRKGTLLCKMALEMDKFQPELYLNLGLIYLNDNQKSKATKTFRKGLDYAGKNDEITEQLIKLGARRKPPIPFLHRNNFINKHLGVFLHRLRTRGAPRHIRFKSTSR